MAPRSRSRARRKQPSSAPLGAGFLVVVLLGGTAAVLAWNANAPPAQGTSRPAETESRPDVFANVPADGAPTRSSPARSSSASDPLSPEAARATEADWQDALEHARRAETALREAHAALEAGANDQASARGAEAQTLYSRALELANPWLEALSAQYGRDDPQVQTVDRKTRAWAKELVFLKKSARL